MRKLYYTLQTLLRGHSSNAVKLISLTLGLLAGLLLFTQIAYELSYDTFYKNHDRLVVLQRTTTEITTQTTEEDLFCFRPAAAALAESLPQLVESATPVFTIYQPDLYLKENKLDNLDIIFADTLYFPTMGLTLLSGNTQDLAQPATAFIAKSKAHQLFGSENPIGKTLSFAKSFDITIKGVFNDLPANTLFPVNLLISLPTLDASMPAESAWSANDVFNIFLRMNADTDIDELNAQVTKAIGRYTATEHDGIRQTYSVVPIQDIYLSSPDNQRRIGILTLLGIAIVFVSIMNYVLASVASINQRAKAVGVHKCCGADEKSILGLFLAETGMVTITATAISLLLIFLFREPVEELLGINSVTDLFTPDTIWVPVLTAALLFLIAGLLPGYMYAQIPVSQVFKRYTDNKRTWKRSLLFVQFAGVAMAGGLLLTSIYQYHELMNRPVGFDTNNLVTGMATAGFGTGMDGLPVSGEGAEEAIARQPYVKSVSRSEYNMLAFYNQIPLKNKDGNMVGTLHYQFYGKDLPQTVGLTLLQGRWPRQEGEAVVGESTLKEMGWTDSWEGRKLPCPASIGNSEQAIVTGVVKDVRNTGFFQQQTSTAYVLAPRFCYQFHVRLKEPAEENLQQLNQFVQTVYPQSGLHFRSYHTLQREIYQDVRRFRDIVWTTSACILLIVLMGLTGYANNETQRRSKEIALRKVNGAEASDILRLFAVDILKIAVVALIIGTSVAWYMSRLWMQQFADCAMMSSAWFLFMAFALLLFIILIVVLRAWKIANSNPIISLKQE